MKLSRRVIKVWTLGEGEPRESSINDKRIVTPTHARKQRTRGDTD